MIKLLKVLLFILCFVNVVSASTLNVSIYGDYNFATKNFSVYWKSANTYSLYNVKLYKKVVQSSCPEVATSTFISAVATSASTASFTNIEVPILQNEKYLVEIYGNANNLDTLIFTQEFHLFVSSTGYQIQWQNCSNLNEVEAYKTETVGFDFGEPLTYSTWNTQTYSSSSLYFKNINLLFRYKNSSTDFGPISAQVIIFSGKPETPKWGTQVFQ